MKIKIFTLSAALCSLGGPLIGAQQRVLPHGAQLALVAGNALTHILPSDDFFEVFLDRQSPLPPISRFIGKAIIEGMTATLRPAQALHGSAFRLVLAATLSQVETYARTKLDAGPRIITGLTATCCDIFSPFVSAKQFPLLLGTSALMSSALVCALHGIGWAGNKIKLLDSRPITRRAAAANNLWGEFLLDALANNNESDVSHAVEHNAALNGEYRSRHAAQLAATNEGSSAKQFHVNFFRETPCVGYDRKYLQDQAEFFSRIWSDPFSPLAYAAALGNCHLVSLLLDKGAAVDYQMTNGRTALHEAAYFGQAATVRLLLRAGANPECIDSKGHTALTLAASLQHRDVLKTLLQHGTEVPPAEQIAQLGLSEQTRTLIDQEAHIARQRSTAIEKKLLQQDSDLSTDLASLIRSFETPTTSTVTPSLATSTPSISEKNTKLVNSLIMEYPR